MPFYKTIDFSPNTKILLWKIEEEFDDLFDAVVLTDTNMIRLFAMKSKQHQLGFMSVRRLLQEAGYSDHDLYYDEFGKPHLKDEKHISISHSHEFSAIIITDENTGIDLELRRPKVALLADKFCEFELKYLNPEITEDYISRLTVIWGIKEAIFKIRNEQGISFKEHIKVLNFEMADNECRAWLHFGDIAKDYNVYFEEIANYTLVYAFEN